MTEMLPTMPDTPVPPPYQRIDLVHRPEGDERIDVTGFLQDGGTVRISFDPGQSGAVDEDGVVTQEPIEECFIVTAHDHDGAKIGSGTGHSVAKAMLRLHRPPAPDPSAYSTEPPF
ncbi:hypothetical protein ACFU7Y_05840 [Kitasatospora sp. NPDC057542]|uniref:hypothetical protein n=1 Tax=Streptomycetaceae TaxID=2062 RepID=UPI001CCFB001|nr:hypothetical protein [Streptomyces sp. LS1784]